MDDTPRPLGFGIELGKVVNQSQTLIRDKQLDALQTAIPQLTQKLSPTGLVFLGPFTHSQDLPVAALRNADRHQNRDVLDLASQLRFNHSPWRIT